MANKDDLYTQFLDSNWAARARSDSRAPCCFMTYFKSKDVLLRALRELSYADFSSGDLVLPDDMKVSAQVMTDRKRIVLALFAGLFTREQAHEVIPAFGKHANYKANKKEDMQTFAENYLAELKKEGKFQIVVAW